MKNITAALLSVQSEIKPFLKDTVNPYYNSKFVELSTILEAVKPLLNKHRILLLQPTGIENGQFVMQTVLRHESGEECISSYIIDVEKQSPQKLAGALTFARRYALVSLLGISCDTDDDGNNTDVAIKPVKSTVKPATKTKVIETTVSEKTPVAEIVYSAFVPVNFSEKNFGTDDAPKWSYSVQDGSKTWYSAWDDDLGTLLREAHKNRQEIKVGWRIKGKYKNIVDVNPSAETLAVIKF